MTIFKTLPLSDGTNGFRFRGIGINGLYRKRLAKKRYGLTIGDTFRAFHLGKRSIYIEQFRPVRVTYNWLYQFNKWKLRKG